MTERKHAARQELDRLTDLLVDDIMQATDDQVLAELREEGIDPVSNAADMQVLLDKAMLNANKRRLHAAKAAVQVEKNGHKYSSKVFDIAEARRRLHGAIQQKTQEFPLTMAARKESELSDADIISMAQDLDDLGLLPPDTAH